MNIPWSKIFKYGLTLGGGWLWEKVQKKALPKKAKKLLETDEAKAVIKALADAQAKAQIAEAMVGILATQERLRATLDRHSENLGKQAKDARDKAGK